MTSRLCTMGAGRCKGGVFPGNQETTKRRPWYLLHLPLYHSDVQIDVYCVL